MDNINKTQDLTLFKKSAIVLFTYISLEGTFHFLSNATIFENTFSTQTVE